MEPVLLASGWRLREQDSKGAKPADLPIQKPVLDIRPPGSTVRVAAFPVARRRRAPPPRRRQVVNALNGLQCSLPAPSICAEEPSRPEWSTHLDDLVAL